MSRRLSDRELDRLLAELPRDSASPGFSNRVLTDLGTPARRRASRTWLLAAAAGAMALTVGLWLLPRAAREPAVTEAQALREEHRLLVEELESLKASLRASQKAPVLYLGGNENLDLVLDLEPVWQGEATGGVRPAVYDGGERPMVTTNQREGDKR